MIRLSCLVALIFFPLFVNAQTDSTKQLKEVNITGLRLEHVVQSSRIETIDTSATIRMTAFTLTELLENNSSAFIKDNGAGRLATLSIRGTTASQNNITWNGLSLNTPTLGLFDLSLVPVFFVDRAQVQIGGNGSLNGSDAVGGVVHLNSVPAFNHGLNITLFSSAASFSDFQQGLKVQYGDSKVAVKSALYNRTALNNFPFEDIYIAGVPELKQKHSSLSQQGLLHEISFLRQHNIYSIHLMSLNARHEVPSLMGSLSRNSEQIQFDEQLRTVAQWLHHKNNFRSSVNLGWMKDKIHYIDPNTNLNDLSKGSSLQGSAELSYDYRQHNFSGGTIIMQSEAFVNSTFGNSASGYPEKHRLHESAVYINYRYALQRFSSQASLRYKISAIGNDKLVPSAYIHYLILKSLKVAVNVSGVYRNPTLNDMYWKPGGNRNLHPEKGYHGDINLILHRKNGGLTTDFTAAMFYLNIKDFIQWLPGADNIYSPVNRNRIHSRGLEGITSLNYQTGKWNYSIHANVQYTASVNSDAGDKQETILKDISNGLQTIQTPSSENQLIYIPRLSWNTSGGISYSNTSLNFSYGYTGYRFTTEDNMNWLDPYFISNAVLSQKWLIVHKEFTVTTAVNNLFDEQYQVVALRPMPGRNFRVSLMVIL